MKFPPPRALPRASCKPSKMSSGISFPAESSIGFRAGRGALSGTGRGKYCCRICPGRRRPPDRPGLDRQPPAVTPEQPWLAWIISAVIIVALLVAEAGSARGVSLRGARRSARRSQTCSAVASPIPLLPLTRAGRRSRPLPSRLPQTPRMPLPLSELRHTPAAPSPTADSDAAAAPAAVADRSDRAENRGRKRTKVTVAADSDVVFDGTMKAGENHIFTAKDHFEISARDAGAVQLELNGKTLAPIGPSGHSGKITLTRDALKGAAGGGKLAPLCTKKFARAAPHRSESLPSATRQPRSPPKIASKLSASWPPIRTLQSARKPPTFC